MPVRNAPSQRVEAAFGNKKDQTINPTDSHSVHKKAPMHGWPRSNRGAPGRHAKSAAGGDFRVQTGRSSSRKTYRYKLSTDIQILLR